MCTAPGWLPDAHGKCAYGEHGFDATGIGNAIVRQVTMRLLAEHKPGF
jgi:hypothetical protein